VATGEEDTGSGSAAANQFSTESCIAHAESDLMWVAELVAAMIGHHIVDDSLQHPSALTLAAVSAGPGSDLQQQLFSLLCSMVKLGTAPGHAAATAASSSVAASAAALQNNDNLPEGGDSLVGVLITWSDQLITVAASTAAVLVAGAVDAGAGDNAIAMLPSLFILGRCCAWWAEQLRSNASRERLVRELAKFLEEGFLAELVLPPVQQWLQASGTQTQLLAAGYAPQGLPQQLQQVVAALKVARDSAVGGHIDTAYCLQAAQLLQAAGSVLCSFAVPCACNNPACLNLSGLTELGLVSGRSCICGGCRVARYCGRACQRVVWKQHKPICAALAAAASAEGGTVLLPVTSP
jgi:hypothetical protein